MHLDDLHTFVHVGERGSFSTAGDALGVPRSTVSRRIARLEDDLGVQLFHRTTRTVKLTELGRVLFERYRSLIQELEGVETLLADARDVPTGRLRVSFPVDLGSVFGGRLLHRFHERYPDVEVEAQTSDRFVDLVEEGVDVALRISSKPLADSASLVARRLAVVTTELYAADCYLEQCKAPRRPRDLLRHDVVAGGEGVVRWKLTHTRTGKIEQLSVTPALRLDNLFMVRDALAEGAGVGWVPAFLARPARLQRVLPAWQLPAATLWAVWPLARQLSPTVRAFVDQLVEEIPSLLAPQ